jgi:hypothetical protein
MQFVNLKLIEAGEVECCSRELPQMKLSRCRSKKKSRRCFKATSTPSRPWWGSNSVSASRLVSIQHPSPCQSKLLLLDLDGRIPVLGLQYAISASVEILSTISLHEKATLLTRPPRCAHSLVRVEQHPL